MELNEGLRKFLKDGNHKKALEIFEKVESGELNAVFRDSYGFTGNCSIDERFEVYLSGKGVTIIDCNIIVE